MNAALSRTISLAISLWHRLWLKDGEVVGHVPRVLSKTTSFFLRYEGNVVFCEIAGERLNRGVQLGVEVPCLYKFYGRELHLAKLKERRSQGSVRTSV